MGAGVEAEWGWENERNGSGGGGLVVVREKALVARIAESEEWAAG